jgi:hypothetical protein
MLAGSGGRDRIIGGAGRDRIDGAGQRLVPQSPSWPARHQLRALGSLRTRPSGVFRHVRYGVVLPVAWTMAELPYACCRQAVSEPPPSPQIVRSTSASRQRLPTPINGESPGQGPGSQQKPQVGAAPGHFPAYRPTRPPPVSSSPTLVTLPRLAVLLAASRRPAPAGSPPRPTTSSRRPPKAPERPDHHCAVLAPDGHVPRAAARPPAGHHDDRGATLEVHPAG